MLHTGTKGFLKACFDTALAWPIAHAGFRGLTFSAAYAASSDFHPITHSGILPFMKGFSEVRRLIKITDAIDDIVDTTDVSVIAAEDFTRDQEGISRFLRNPRFVPTAFLQTLASLDRKHVLEYEVGIGYSNSFCDYVRERAHRQMFLAKTHDGKARSDMAEANVNFAGLFGSFFFGLVQPPQQSLRDGVSYEAVANAYPEVYQINRAGQMLDDLRDLILDIEDEAFGGQVSPNIILSHVKGRFDHSTITNFASCAQGHTSVPVAAMPAELQDAVHAVEEEFDETVSKIRSRASRNIMESFWRNTVREKIPTSINPLIIKKMQAEARMAQSLQPSMPY